jgi:glycosyltransferase involved in cell wall biosynthesis
MLRGENILCVSWLRWDHLPLVPQHMMRRLAKRNRVLFVDPQVALSTVVRHPLSMRREVVGQVRAWLGGVKRVSESLHVYYPPPTLLQTGHVAWNDELNRRLLAGAIRRVAKRLGIDSPILWLYEPYAVRPAGQFGEKLVVYECNDDVSSFATLAYKRENLRRLEDDLARSADVVIATSRSLHEAKKRQNPRAHYFPSAVDFELFHSATSPTLPVPEDVARLPKPILGYVGSITNYRIEWDWIRAAIAAENVRGSFVFVGPCVEPPPRDLVDSPSVRFVGPRPPEALPGYLKAFDVCMIPYKGEEFLKACQPTKTFEYLAGGKPVVSADIPEIAEHHGVVRTSRTAAEFVAAIEAALRDAERPDTVARCVEAARGRTWDDRVERVGDLVAEALAERASRDAGAERRPAVRMS